MLEYHKVQFYPQGRQPIGITQKYRNKSLSGGFNMSIDQQLTLRVRGLLM